MPGRQIGLHTVSLDGWKQVDSGAAGSAAVFSGALYVNGVLATCNVKTTFAPMIDGFNYFEVSAGDVDFAAFVWYTS